MTPIIKAMREAPACAEHRAPHKCYRWTSSDESEPVLVGGPRDDPDFHENDCLAFGHAATCPACAASVANAVLVAARDGDAEVSKPVWMRAAPAWLLERVRDDTDEWNGTINGAAIDELRRREKEETR